MRLRLVLVIIAVAQPARADFKSFCAKLLTRERIVVTAAGPAPAALAEFLGLRAELVREFSSGGMHTVFELGSQRFPRTARLPEALWDQPAADFVVKVNTSTRMRRVMRSRDQLLYEALKQELPAVGVEPAETYFLEDSAGNQIIVQRRVEGEKLEVVTQRLFKAAFHGNASLGHAEDLLYALLAGQSPATAGYEAATVERILAANPDYAALLTQLRKLRDLNEDLGGPIDAAYDRLGDDALVSSRMPWMKMNAIVRVDFASRNMKVVRKNGRLRLVVFDW